MVAAAVRGCDCLKAPRCPETPVQLMGFGARQEGCESSGQQRWVGSVYRVFKTAVLNCIYCRNEQLGCSGSGRVKCWPCPLIPKALEETPACMELAGPGREGPGQQGRKALCTFWVHLSQCYPAGADSGQSACVGTACFTLWVYLESWIGPAECGAPGVYFC